LVETHKRILSKAKLALRPMTILASLARRQGSSINVPLRGTPLTPLRLAELEVCFEPHKKTVDNADDVIHRTWPAASVRIGLIRGSDSRQRLQSGLRFGLAQRFPVAVGALVAEVG
jgi:hypothetical protein